MTPPGDPDRTVSAIDAYLSGLPESTAATLSELCHVIENADSRVRGEIKWNAPSYAIHDHFATTGVEKGGGVRLVLHTGARRAAAPSRPDVTDVDALLTWKDVDRAVVVFDDIEDVRAHERALRTILTEWIAQTQGAPSAASPR